MRKVHVIPHCFFWSAILWIGASLAQAQTVGTAISATGALPNANAMLDVQSPATGDGKGLLIPRVTYLQRVGNNTTNVPGGLVDASGDLVSGVAAQGLLVYQTDGAQGFYYNASTSVAPAWVFVGSGDFMADGSVAMTGNLNMGGNVISNTTFYGDGMGLTNIPSSSITEVDPVWAAASNSMVAQISSRLASNSWADADSTTNYASRLDWAATNAGLQAEIDTKGTGDFKSNGSVAMSASLNLNGNVLTNVGSIDFNSANVQIGENTRSYSTLQGSVAIGAGATARYRTSGVAIGTEADGDYNGIAIGYQSDGQYSNIAIGYAASAYSGYDRVAIGRDITNRRNDSVSIRGTLYLDGGTGVLYRSSVGQGGWSVKAFTIDHPLDPENKVLRHYCMEGPEVWNVYAGNTVLVNGQAVVDLPDYYSALNKADSEIVSLTPWGKATVWAESVENNRLALAGDADVKVSWTIKVLRDDPACVEDKKHRPVEQLKSELDEGQADAENQSVNTTQRE
jgi:hypothetical protein